MKSELLIAITQLSSEKNLPREVVLQTVEKALASAYKKEYDFAGQDLSVKVNQNTGEIKVYVYKNVVEKVSDPRKEISLGGAKNQKRDVHIGDTIPLEVTQFHAGRIAAQTTRQVVLQRLKEAEHDVIYSEYAHKEGDIVGGIVQRVEPKNVIVNLSKAEAIMPPGEQIKGERYRSGQRMRVYLLEVAHSGSSTQLIVSRSHRNFLKRLLELEVPEIASGIVEIKSIAREAGSRSKVAVTARQENIDPVGSCVGPRGIRIQNIITELNGEKIDVVLWSENPRTYIANALSPAKVIKVDVNLDDNRALVIVPEKQFSLAIGKDGQNARLAAKLTGWRIDIKAAPIAEMEAPAKVVPVEALAPAEIKAPKEVVPEPVMETAVPVSQVKPPEIETKKKEAEAVPVSIKEEIKELPKPPRERKKEAPKLERQVIPAEEPPPISIEEVFASLEKTLEKSSKRFEGETTKPQFEKIEAKPKKAKKKLPSEEEELEFQGKGKKARPQRMLEEEEEED